MRSWLQAHCRTGLLQLLLLFLSMGLSSRLGFFVVVGVCVVFLSIVCCSFFVCSVVGFCAALVVGFCAALDVGFYAKISFLPLFM